MKLPYRMEADCAYRIGKSHLVCQDYALARSGASEETPYVLLADGCSSSPDTDFGARLLAKSAERLVTQLPEPGAATFAESLQAYHFDAIRTAREHARTLGLADNALDATLLTLAVRGDSWFASVFGDGVVAAMDHEGCLHLQAVSYLGGYPYYASYLTDADRHDALLQRQDNLRLVEVSRLCPDGSLTPIARETCPADAPCPYLAGTVADFAWAAVLSDGVHSFARTATSETPCVPASVPFTEVLPALLAFKTRTGQFVQRRLQRFAQQCAASGWQHHDDLCVGALSFDSRSFSES